MTPKKNLNSYLIIQPVDFVCIDDDESIFIPQNENYQIISGLTAKI
ncbi:hypothetical protein CASFOL_026875 [Castilleja foliolosa]|uniref:Uncharacterized protein n=1 Tax=Castilleja foliolosa TaxID=1961234 RepID=A0ABD3CIB0_9LAMI